MTLIYLDNAATTPLLTEVIETISQSMKVIYGNPSSTHSVGQAAKAAVEMARKNIAKHLQCSAQEIIFTAGGSEADNLVLYNAVNQLGVKTIISSPIEHHAILHTLDFLKQTYHTNVLFVNICADGSVDYAHLEQLLNENLEQKLVSLMYVNNETGSMLQLKKVADLCKQHQTYFHSDTVQGIGHFSLNLNQIPVDFIAASAHKFHGPKGVGFAFIRKGISFKPLWHGGEQEHGLRAGTENLHSIMGMEKAMEIAYQNLESDQKYIASLKAYFVTQLQKLIPNIQFNAQSDTSEQNAYHILNVRFAEPIEMFLFKLNLQGIAASGGSACQSGGNKGSHVLKAILNEKEAQKTSVRFSFSKQNTIAEIDIAINTIGKIIQAVKS